MARLFYVHWNDAELAQRVTPLREAGHVVIGHSSQLHGPALKEALPDALVISLARLPSHGRAVAEWFWEAKKRQAIPLIFVDGEKAKVMAMRARFPAAKYCTSGRLLAVVAKLATTTAATNTRRQRATP